MQTKQLTHTLLAALCAGAFLLGSGAASAATTSDAVMAQDPASIVNAAKKEGSVTWYSVLDPNQMNELAAKFEKTYGVHVNIIRSTTGKLVQRYDSELSAGKVAADLLSISDALYYHHGSAKNLFAKFTDKALPNLKAWPKDAVADGNTLTLSINPFVIAYNTNQISEAQAPKTWKDLLDKQYAGNMGAPNFSVSSTYVEFLDMWKDTLGEGFLEKYGQQKKRYYDSSVPGNQALAAGEFAVFAPTMPIFAQPIIDKGAPIKLVFVPETTGNVIFAAVSNHAPHPHAAVLFMNYLLSHDAQETINKGMSATLLPDVKGSLVLSKEYRAPKAQEAADQKSALLKAIGLHN